MSYLGLELEFVVCGMPRGECSNRRKGTILLLDQEHVRVEFKKLANKYSEEELLFLFISIAQNRSYISMYAFLLRQKRI